VDQKEIFEKNEEGLRPLMEACGFSLVSNPAPLGNQDSIVYYASKDVSVLLRLPDDGKEWKDKHGVMSISRRTRFPFLVWLTYNEGA
jgi:hypothetical protein